MRREDEEAVVEGNDEDDAAAAARWAGAEDPEAEARGRAVEDKDEARWFGSSR
jgi:hypothetical protein